MDFDMLQIKHVERKKVARLKAIYNKIKLKPSNIKLKC
jgi:hypothetical protein